MKQQSDVARVVIAPDAFKGSISAADAARALRDGWTSIRPGDDIRLVPMADGGEGTLEAFATSVPGSVRVPVRVSGPLGTPVDTEWLLLPPTPDAPSGTAVVELARTSGIELLGDGELRPLDAHTRGFGEAIRAAIAHRVSRLVVGIGGSCSTDGGTGMLTALGARFADAAGDAIASGGRGLADLASADLSGLIAPPPGGVRVLSDVTNPLLGVDGAAAVFGPQKGATHAEVEVLDEGLTRLAGVLDADPDRPGAGAAGGTGFALLAWGAQLIGGATAVAELVGLPAAIGAASVVVTGEGSFDGQSAAGKAPAHVAALAAARGISAVLVAGRITADPAASGFTDAVSLTDLAGSADAALGEPDRWLRAAGAALARRADRMDE